MEACFGYKGRAAVAFIQFSMAFGGMCAFAVILGDTIPREFGLHKDNALGNIAKPRDNVKWNRCTHVSSARLCEYWSWKLPVLAPSGDK